MGKSRLLVGAAAAVALGAAVPVFAQTSAGGSTVTGAAGNHSDTTVDTSVDTTSTSVSKSLSLTSNQSDSSQHSKTLTLGSYNTDNSQRTKTVTADSNNTDNSQRTKTVAVGSYDTNNSQRNKVLTLDSNNSDSSQHNKTLTWNNTDNSQRNGNIHMVADQSLDASVSNAGPMNFNGRHSNYGSGANNIGGSAFAAYSGILNQGWNTGINANSQAATNIAAQGTTSFATH